MFSIIWVLDRKSLLGGNILSSLVVKIAKCCCRKASSSRAPEITNILIVRPSSHFQTVPAKVSTMVMEMIAPVVKVNPVQSIFKSLERILGLDFEACMDGR